ncbi:peptidoglycan endopeptidase [Polymorphobacter sp.]|uniref:peptidoglycan endopeptidase n=1 Tax=Polymorphobacter sp. TaxID=1909290 RepID=UPI003F6E9307
MSGAGNDVRLAAIVSAARGCLGTRFRRQGRVVGLGLDCVGVVAIAARAAGLRVGPLPAYDQSADNLALLERVLRDSGCMAVSRERAVSGDMAVIAPAAGRLHLGVLTPCGIVHAHAGLGRVVEGPLDPAWAWVGAWRFLGAH